MDSTNYGGFAFLPPNREYTPATLAGLQGVNINACHSGGANATFADGHAKWMSMGSIVVHAGPTGAWGGWIGIAGGADNWFDRE